MFKEPLKCKLVISKIFAVYIKKCFVAVVVTVLFWDFLAPREWCSGSGGSKMSDVKNRISLSFI